MSQGKKKDPVISNTEESQVTNFLGVKYSVLLPREKSECVEILLERFPKGLAFPIHQHKECEQTYLVLEGEGEVTVAGRVQKIVKDDAMKVSVDILPFVDKFFDDQSKIWKDSGGIIESLPSADQEAMLQKISSIGEDMSANKPALAAAVKTVFETTAKYK